MRRWLGLALLLLLVSGSAVAGLFHPAVQQQWLRPRLERLLADRLSAEVRIATLRLTPTRLLLTELHLATADGNRLSLPRLQADWSLASLRTRQLQALVLDGPELEWRLAPAAKGGASLPVWLPVRTLDLRDGRLRLHLAGRDWRGEALQLRLDEAQQLSLSAQAGTEELLPLTAAGKLGPGPSLRLHQLVVDGAELLTAPLELTPGAQPDQLRLRFDQLDRARLQRLLAAAGQDDPLPPKFDYNLTAAELSWQGTGPVLELTVAAAELRWQGRELLLGETRLRAEAGDGWQLAGQMELPTAARATANGHWRDGRWQGELQLELPDAAALAATLAAPLPLTGGAQLTATAAGTEGDLSLDWQLKGVAGPVVPDLISLSGLEATGWVERQDDRWTIGATAMADGRPLLRLDGDLQQWRWQLPANDGRLWRARLPAAWWPATLGEVTALAGEGNIRLMAEGNGGSFQLCAAKAKVGPVGLTGLAASGRIDGSGDSWRLRLDRLAGRFSGAGLPSGALSGRGELSGGKALRLRLTELALTELEFMSADGLSGLAGGRLRLGGSATRTTAGSWALDLTGTANAAELLAGSFYANTAALPASFRLLGGWDGARRQLTAQQLALELSGLGQVTAQGRLALAGWSGSGDFRLPALGGPAWTPLLQGLQGMGPLWAELAASGSVAGRFTGGGGDGWRLDGDLQLEGLGLDWPGARLRLAGLHGELPFHFGTAGADTASSGWLAFDNARFALAQLTAGRLPVEAGRNRFRLPATLPWQLAGGRLELVEPEVTELIDTPALAAGIRVEQVQLLELTRELGLPPMAGALGADLGRIRYAGGGLASAGQARIDAFGGSIRIDGIRGHDLFGPFPGLEADIAFAGIDLGELTRTFSFGEMHGIVDGEIRRLRLLGAIPSRFEASLESRPGGRRDISVKAINNLSVLSQGSFMSVLGRGLYRFIDFYRYRKIGLVCRLENDRFQLQGTARPGSTNHLVDGGLLPPKIDIIAPPGDISFNEMLRRLQRIDRGG